MSFIVKSLLSHAQAHNVADKFKIKFTIKLYTFHYANCPFKVFLIFEWKQLSCNSNQKFLKRITPLYYSNH